MQQMHLKPNLSVNTLSAALLLPRVELFGDAGWGILAMATTFSQPQHPVQESIW